MTIDELVSIIESSHYLFAHIDSNSNLWIDVRSQSVDIVIMATEMDVFNVIDGSPVMRSYLEGKGYAMEFDGNELIGFRVPSMFVA